MVAVGMATAGELGTLACTRLSAWQLSREFLHGHEQHAQTKPLLPPPASKRKRIAKILVPSSILLQCNRTGRTARSTRRGSTTPRSTASTPSTKTQLRHATVAEFVQGKQNQHQLQADEILRSRLERVGSWLSCGDISVFNLLIELPLQMIAKKVLPQPLAADIEEHLSY